MEHFGRVLLLARRTGTQEMDAQNQSAPKIKKQLEKFFCSLLTKLDLQLSHTIT